MFEPAGAGAGSPPPPPPPLPPSAPPPPPPIIAMAPAPRPRGGWVWKLLALVFMALFALSFFSNMFGGSPLTTSRAHVSSERNHNLDEFYLERTNASDNKIAVITVDGVISSAEEDRTGLTLQEFIAEQLKAAAADSDVKAVLLKVDSPGGEVLASDEINKSLRKFQDDSHKPVVVSMGNLAASGGYYISVPARWIVCNEMTITGSIGVIMHAYNYRLLMDKVGLRPEVFKSGKFKDMLSGEREPDQLSDEDRRIRDEENSIVQGFIDETYHKFRSVVQAGRDAAAKANGADGHPLIADWAQYADGRILSGHQALDRGFVDELGDFDTAVARAEKLTGIPNASLIEYRVPVDLNVVLSHLLGKSETPSIKVDLGINLPQLKAGLPYYILPTAVAR